VKCVKFNTNLPIVYRVTKIRGQISKVSFSYQNINKNFYQHISAKHIPLLLRYNSKCLLMQFIIYRSDRLLILV